VVHVLIHGPDDLGTVFYTGHVYISVHSCGYRYITVSCTVVYICVYVVVFKGPLVFMG
jgi:hypothetical protein